MDNEKALKEINVKDRDRGTKVFLAIFGAVTLLLLAAVLVVENCN